MCIRDRDYGVIGNPTKATKEKGDKLVEAVVEGYSELIKELLETHPVGKNPLGFRNPLGLSLIHILMVSMAAFTSGSVVLPGTP